MFLHEVGSSDSRFKTLRFHEGMNLVLADKTEESTSGESRNGAGKSSFVRILRYLLGGDLDVALKSPDLQHQAFRASILLPEADEPLLVERPVKPTTHLTVAGTDYRRDEWRHMLAKSWFALPGDVREPTAGHLIGQIMRTSFHDAVKTWPQACLG